jgi:DNA-binding LacI/PurR family transcriptional regulator
MKRATITEVAELAGVSRAAVSKVLRDAYGLSDDMRRRVQVAMDKLDYRPQTAARGLRGRTYTLGVLIPDIRNPFFPDILDGVMKQLEGTQYKTFLGIGHSERRTEHELVDTMIDNKMDGLILIAPRLESEYLQALSAKVPCVLIGRHQSGDGFDTVNNDDEQGARLVVDHLAGLGHTRISHLALLFAQDYGQSVNIFRQRGYVSQMEKHGLEPDVLPWEGTFADAGRTGALAMLGHDPRFPWSFAWRDDGRGGAEKLLTSKQRPTAIFGWTDNVAFGAMSAAAEMGISVPNELSIVGYDNSGICDIKQISLTSVDQSAHVLGETSARLLVERIEGRTEESHFVAPPRLVVRGSTAPPG